MITLNGIRNALWCVVAFGIIACAATFLPTAPEHAVSRQPGGHVEMIASNDDQAVPGRPAAGSP